MVTVEERKRFLGTNKRSTQASQQSWSWRKTPRREKREKEKKGERKEKFVGAQINTASESTDDRKPWKDDSLLAGWSGFQHILDEYRQQEKRDSIHTRVSCYLGARGDGEKRKEDEEKKKEKKKKKSKNKPKQKRAVNDGVCSLCLRTRMQLALVRGQPVHIISN